MSDLDHHGRRREPRAQRSLLDERTHLDGRSVLAWCVAPSGDRWPWLVDLAAEADGPGCECQDCAPDEQLGPLPAETAQRLREVLARPPRCGGPRTGGGACRALVRAYGRRCHWHPAPPTTSSAKPGALDQQRPDRS